MNAADSLPILGMVYKWCEGTSLQFISESCGFGMFIIIQDINIIVPIRLQYLCSFSRLSNNSSISPFNSSIIIFLLLWYEFLSNSINIDSLDALFRVRSGRIWYIILLLKKIPTPTPVASFTKEVNPRLAKRPLNTRLTSSVKEAIDLSVVWLSAKLYPLILYKRIEFSKPILSYSDHWKLKFEIL